MRWKRFLKILRHPFFDIFMNLMIPAISKIQKFTHESALEIHITFVLASPPFIKDNLAFDIPLYEMMPLGIRRSHRHFDSHLNRAFFLSIFINYRVL